MKPKILIIDDFEEIRELIGFIIESHLDIITLQAPNGFEAIKILKMNPDVQVIVSSLHMPNGSGEDVFKFLRSENRSTPIVFMTGDDLKSYPLFRGNFRLQSISKPFTDDDLMVAVRSFLSAPVSSKSNSYIPVRLELLMLVADINTPLFVKINESKFVKITQEHARFSDDLMTKYKSKSITHLYIETLHAEEFIIEYRKKTISDLAWDQAGSPDGFLKGADTVKFNTELLRDLSAQFGWNLDLVEIAQSHFQRALKLASTNSDLSAIFHHFLRIERYGYADHCTLLFLVAAKVCTDLGIDDSLTLRKLTFAALFHDMSLTHEQYEHKEKLLKQNVREVTSHPARAAELCRNWDFCPGVVDSIVFQHHEKPNGRGFPMGKKTAELHPLSCLFIVCEDFVDFYFLCHGKPDLQVFGTERLSLYETEPFKTYFAALLQALQKSLTKAS